MSQSRYQQLLDTDIQPAYFPSAATATSKEKKAEPISLPNNHLAARRLLSTLVLAAGPPTDTYQFCIGLIDTPSIFGVIKNSRATTSALTTLYFLQSFALNSDWTIEGIRKIHDLFWRNLRISGWVELTPNRAKLAWTLSLATNITAHISDALAYAYCFEQTGWHRGAAITFGILGSLSNIPTEGLGNYLATRRLLSNTGTTVKNALKKLEQSKEFKAVVITADRKELYGYIREHLYQALRTALEEPENTAFFDDTSGTKLAKELQSIFVDNYYIEAPFAEELPSSPEYIKINEEPSGLTTSSTALPKNLFNIKRILTNLKVDAGSYADVLSRLSDAATTEQEIAKLNKQYFWQRIGSGTDYAIKFLVRMFGASQDTLGSYATAVSVLALTSLELKILLLLLSVSNGLNELSFGGENSVAAIDALKEKLKAGMPSPKEILLFLSWFFSACLIGEAQRNLIFQALCPEVLPEKAAHILSTLGVIAPVVNCTYYFHELYGNAKYYANSLFAWCTRKKAAPTVINNNTSPSPSSKSPLISNSMFADTDKQSTEIEMTPADREISDTLEREIGFQF